MSISAAALIKQLQDHQARIFTTADVVTLTGLNLSSATHALRRLNAQGLLSSLKRGFWVSQLVGPIDPLEAVSPLTAPWPSYISLYSALSRHGVIDEVPQTHYVVTAGRSARIQTALGDFRIHHLPVRLLWGFTVEHHGQAAYPMADREKAFLDTAYLGLIPRSPLGLPYKRDGKWELDYVKLASYAKRFRYPPLIKFLKSRQLWRPSR